MGGRARGVQLRGGGWGGESSWGAPGDGGCRRHVSRAAMRGGESGEVTLRGGEGGDGLRGGEGGDGLRVDLQQIPVCMPHVESGAMTLDAGSDIAFSDLGGSELEGQAMAQAARLGKRSEAGVPTAALKAGFASVVKVVTMLK